MTWSATWWLSTAPSAETPIEPPIERKNATSELAAPMSDVGDVVLHGEHEVLHGGAEAEAEDRHEDADQRRAVVVASIVASRREADDDQRPCRRRGSASRRPVSVMIRPVTMLETSRPPTIAIDIRPASVGLMPRASWKYWLR